MGAFIRRMARSAVRVLAAWALVAGGALALTGALAAGIAGSARTTDGSGQRSFTAPLTPVHTDGHAIVVPDIGAALARHGLARLLGDGRLTITVRSMSVRSSDLLVAELVPSPDAVRYYSGTAHAEVLGVGYATGAQPVQVVDRPGPAPTAPVPWELGARSTPAREVTVTLDVPTVDPVALVVRRPDHATDLTVALTVGLAPASWSLVTLVLVISGGLATLCGLALLWLRRPLVEVPDDRAGLADTPPLVREISPYVYTAT